MLRATDSGNIPGFDGLRRRAETTAEYAEAVRRVGRERGVVVCDVWSAMMRLAGWVEGWTGPLPGCEEAPENEVLRGFFSDGEYGLDGQIGVFLLWKLFWLCGIKTNLTS